MGTMKEVLNSRRRRATCRCSTSRCICTSWALGLQLPTKYYRLYIQRPLPFSASPTWASSRSTYPRNHNVPCTPLPVSRAAAPASVWCCMSRAARARGADIRYVVAVSGLALGRFSPVRRQLSSLQAPLRGDACDDTATGSRTSGETDTEACRKQYDPLAFVSDRDCSQFRGGAVCALMQRICGTTPDSPAAQTMVDGNAQRCTTRRSSPPSPPPIMATDKASTTQASYTDQASASDVALQSPSPLTEHLLKLMNRNPTDVTGTLPYVVSVSPSTTVQQLKDQLHHSYRYKPPIASQRLIDTGRLPSKPAMISSIVTDVHSPAVNTFHLVVSSRAAPQKLPPSTPAYTFAASSSSVHFALTPPAPSPSPTAATTASATPHRRGRC